MVHVDGLTSSMAPVIYGVLQGSVLGPLLFLLYINNLQASVKSNVHLFADDGLIYRQIYKVQD